MATVYSMICFGGRTGKTVTMTIASPCVVTLTNHGLRNGTGVVFTTSGALPTGVTSGTTYYARYVAANTFHLYDTYANAIDTGSTTGRVNTSGSQSGTHTVKGAYFLGLSSGQLARYGASGSERIYDGLNAFISGRSGASFSDEEICEIAEAYDDFGSANADLASVPAGSVTLTTMVDGVRGAAFHGGVLGAGYIFKRPTANVQSLLNIRLSNRVDGFTVQVTTSSHAGCWAVNLSSESTAENMIAIGGFNSMGQGFYSNSASTIRYCLATGFRDGFWCNQYSVGNKVYNCISVNNVYGFAGGNSSPAYQTTSIAGYFYNNVAVGNTTNWHSVAGQNKATNNAGLTGEAWMVGTGSTRLTIATTDFADYSGTGTAPAWTVVPDLSPAAASSPQVETGTGYYLAPEYDIAGNEAPRYIGTTADTTVSAGSFVTGYSYVIVSVGTTDFTLIGASANTIGVQFKATGAGSGSGTATATATRDAGCFEFDHGQGNWPIVATVTVTGLTTGSRLKATRVDNGAVLHNGLETAGTVTFTTGYAGAVAIEARNASGTPTYRPWSAQVTTVAGETVSTTAIQQLDE